jgi:hypothetical protein
VARVWKAHGLRPGKGPKAQGSAGGSPRTIRDVEGVYLTPQTKAVVLQVYEPGARPQPEEPSPAATPAATPRKAGDAAAQPQPKRVGNDLLRAVRLLYNAHILPSHSRHPHQEFLLFLRAVDQDVAPERELFLLLESAEIASDRSIQGWLKHRPRFRVYAYPPNSHGGIQGSGWPKELVEPPSRPGVSENFPRLVRAFKLYSETYKRHPRPFVWTAGTPDLARLSPEPRSAEQASAVPGPEPSAPPNPPMPASPPPAPPPLDGAATAAPTTRG